MFSKRSNSDATLTAASRLFPDDGAGDCEVSSRRQVDVQFLLLEEPASVYTLNHKKRDVLFLTITLANLDRFLYHFNREEILHSTVVKICHIARFMCTPYLEKLKPTFCRDS